MPDYRHCHGCGQAFFAERHYHRLCWPCWRAKNGREKGRQSRPTTTDAIVPIVDARTLRAAVALTHPDRHPPERAEQALRTTQALNAALEHVRDFEAAA